MAIQLPGLIILLGIWLGLTLAERFSEKNGVASNTLYNLVFIAMVGGVIGARLSYLIRYPEFFLENPSSIISLNANLFDPVGGFATGLILATIYISRKRLPLWAVLDSLTPFLAVMAVALGLSHLSSGNAYGMESDVLWGIELWGARRHPTQIYETGFAVLILIILWPGWSFWKNKPSGLYFLTFTGLSAVARILNETFRADSALLPGGIRIAQLVAWLILGICLYGIYRLNLSPTDPHGTQKSPDL
jgi:phosphatidylglycerol:prolipoprotein diacylglycerol transferase